MSTNKVAKQDILFIIICVCVCVHAPLPSTRQHPSYGDCLEVKREYYQYCSVLDCVTQCSQSSANLYEQFLQVKQIGFVTLGPLCCALRRLPRVGIIRPPDIVCRRTYIFPLILSFFLFFHASICEGGLGSRNSVRLSVTCMHCDKTK